MIEEITAKTLLSHVKQPDPWFGLRYNMNLYRGCQHQCLYCDSRSLCYQIDNFSDILVKINAVDLLRDELSRKRKKGTIGTGSMNDPYMPVEKQYRLTRQALTAIADFRFPVHILTKSDLVLRDIDLLQTIAQTFALVSFTITAADDDLARTLEPGAPVSSRRLAAIKQLTAAGIPCGVLMMPLLPFIEDTPENITAIVRQAVDAGATCIVPGFGMTLRDRQRAYYYQKLDHHFPGLREQYIRQFGGDYFAPPRDYGRLKEVFKEACERHQVAVRVPVYAPDPPVEQLALF